jgi:hypothetical protein
MTIPALAVGMFALAVNNGLAQRGGSSGRGYSPEDVWARYGGGSGDTIDLNKNPQTAMMLKMKGYSIPPDGILRKADFMPQVVARMQSMGMGGPPGGPPGSMGGPPPMATPSPGGGDKPAVILVPGEEQPAPGGPPRGGPPGSDRGRGDDRGRGEDRGRGGPPGWGDRGGRGEETRKTEEPDDERPNVLRYGKTPKELPGWFTELDTDKDAQIGLYEWRTAGKSIEDFLAKDLNGDGFLTVDEVLKNPTGGTSEAKAESRGGNPFSKGGSTGSSYDPRSSRNDNKSDKNDKGEKKVEKVEAKPSKEERKSEPSSGGNPFLKK